jgi:hypothetical protein
MNEFQYQLMLQKIDDCKYLKDLKTLIYGLPLNAYNFNSSNIQIEIYKYKLFAKAFTKFRTESKSILPDKFYERRVYVQNRLINYITTEESLVDRKQFLSLFEYDDHVQVPSLSDTQVKALTYIIGNEIVPFDMHTSIRSSSLEPSSLFRLYTKVDSTYILETWIRFYTIPRDHILVKLLQRQFLAEHNPTVFATEAEKLATHKILLQHAIDAIDALDGKFYEQQ